MSRIVIFPRRLPSVTRFIGVFVYGMGFIVGFLTPTMLDGAPDRSLTAALGTVSGSARGVCPAAQRHGPTCFQVLAGNADRARGRGAQHLPLIELVALGGLFIFWGANRRTARQVPDGIAVRPSSVLPVWLGTAALHHFGFISSDLFGLTQAPCPSQPRAVPSPQFHTPSLYKVVRHPLDIGWADDLLGVAPTMTVSHLVFAVTTTAYILLAIRFEERELAMHSVSATRRTAGARRCSCCV